MSNLRNTVQLIGRLGDNPEVKDLNGDKKLVKFSLATNETYTSMEGKKVTNTQWHQLVAWGNTAKIAEKYLKKGKEVAIEGRLNHRNYEDKDGVTRYFTEVVVNEIVMLGSNQDKKD
ncbi:MAG: single-stranded DNA-binding protein [Bacteroidales bacterium]|nr:single-stranded DNA-binding protein [Bacteroidales bacterium]